MFCDILYTMLIMIGGIIWGMAITHYWGRKSRVITDFIWLMVVLVISTLMIYFGFVGHDNYIKSVEEQKHKIEVESITNPVIVETLDLDVCS